MVTMGAETLPSGFRSTVGEKGSVIRVTFLPRNWKQEWPSQEISICYKTLFSHKFGRGPMSSPSSYCTIRKDVLQEDSQIIPHHLPPVPQSLPDLLMGH